MEIGSSLSDIFFGATSQNNGKYLTMLAIVQSVKEPMLSRSESRGSLTG